MNKLVFQFLKITFVFALLCTWKCKALIRDFSGISNILADAYFFILGRPECGCGLSNNLLSVVVVRNINCFTVFLTLASKMII